MRPKNSIYTLDKSLVIETFKNVNSLQEAFGKLGFPANSTSYRFARNFAADNDIELPRARPELRLKKANEAAKRKRRVAVPNEEIFRVRSPYSRQMVKNRALQEGILEYKCYGPYCSKNQIALENWPGLTLQLEHKNGIGDDNRTENIELLCPACHSMTPTFGSGNKVRYENGAKGLCGKCGRVSNSKICVICQPAKRSFSAVSIEALRADIAYRGIEVVAADYGMKIDNFKHAVKQRLRGILQDLAAGGMDLAPDQNDSVDYSALSHAPKKKQIEYPPVDKLITEVADRGFVRVAESLDVSDKGLRKHLLGLLGADHDVFDVVARKRFRSGAV